MGYRFRLHRKDLPGCPDIVLPKYRLCILVHGCFWHQHPGCKRATIPETRKKFWRKKFAHTTKRDENSIIELKKIGWKVCTIWECETKDAESISLIVSKYLN
jgi:DNA mismatch endonuclease, patch repair protein